MLRRCCFLVAVVLIGTVCPAMGSGPPGSSAAGRTEASRSAGTVTLTLVTGDRVILRGGAVENVTPGAGRDGMRFRTFWISGDLYVIPADAGRMLAAGRVDERLFNVTQQVEWGYDDAHLGNVPLIVDRPAPGRSTDVSGMSVRRTFGRLGIDAVAVEKSRAENFWRDLTTSSEARQLDDGVRKVWLDGRVEASLDVSVPHIGAPSAWRRGLTGKGVKVAVLDTGYAPGHPDLAGAVTQAKGFTYLGPDNVRDRLGHGTHVASTITGSGAASDGRYKGVAPQAKLAVGKVLDDSGYGLESWIIAGMRWAATTAKADVVNLSLGGSDVRGIDPFERAVNQLTSQTGTLFVVAAGNEGEFGDHTIGSPGSAAAALTVGAVDDKDRLAAFSSRGPRLGDEAVKPDLTAPGVGIKAAVPGGRYASYSGTSMATPHVAGAAAILAQQHPRWRATRLKAALIGSARPTAGPGEFDQGAGRIAIRHAIRQPIVASSGNLSTALRYPQHRTVTRPLTYVNTSGRPVTLTLSEPDEPFHVEDTEITIPAHGRRTIDVTISAQGVEAGTYADTLVARSGEIVVRTLLGAFVEPESYNLRIDVIDRRRVLDDFLLVHSQTNDFHDWVYLRDERARTRLPADDYSVVGFPVTEQPREPYLETLVNHPVDLTGGDTNTVIDLRLAERPTMTVDEPTAVLDSFPRVGVVHDRQDAQYAAADGFGWPKQALRVLPARQPGLTYFQFRDGKQRDTRFSPYSYHVVDRRAGGIPDDPSHHVRTAELAKVTTTYKQTVPESWAEVYAGLLLPGDVELYGSTPPARLPGTVTHYYTPDPDLRWPRQVAVRVGRNYLYDILDDTSTPPTYAPGEHRETWNAAVLGPALPESCFTSISGPAPQCAFRDGDRLVWWGDQNFGVDSGDRGRRAFGQYTGQVTLSLGGEVIGRCRMGLSDCLNVRVPQRPATYRLVADAHRYDWDPTRLNTRVRAAYTFGSGHTDELTALPISAVRFAPGGLDGRNRAAADSTTTIPIWIEQYGDAPIRLLAVQASYDDGETWTDLTVRRDGPDWVTSVDNPASGFVSLRAVATDADGNAVRQTIVRAYAIRR